MLPNASLPPPKKADEPSEDELLLRALRYGDEKAFARALDRFFPAMLRVALSHVGDRADAEEVIQETWLAAIRGIGRFEGRSSVKTWLFRILLNLARTRGKRDARMRPFSTLARTSSSAEASPADALEMVVGNGAAQGRHGHAALWTSSSDPEQQLLRRELGAQIERAIATLPARQREVIVLRDVEGWTADDVCNALAITQTNQRVILHRARDKVRDELRSYLADNGGCGDDDELDVP